MSNEIGIIMAAGLGTRMAPLTQKVPKPLIKVYEQPMIETVINSLERRNVKHIYIEEDIESSALKITEHFPDAEITFYPSIDQCLLAVLAGDATCTTLNGLRANDTLKNSKYKGLSLHQSGHDDDRCFGVEIGNEAARQLYDVLPYLDKLERISFVDCGIDDDVMDKLRRAFPEKEVVWLVRFGWGQAMSDVDRIWAIGGFNDEQLKPLKYCTKVKYLDLGHNGITKLDFLYYMPDLEVAIFENDYLVDLTALGSCKKLEYLEVGETRVTDVSPLAGCESLEHLNIGGLPLLRDISPLYGLTHLKRLYGLCDVNVPQEQIDHIKQLMPDCEIDFQYDPKGAVNGSHWRYTDGGYAERYALLHDQIGYDWLL